jgi:hypothetical protein
MSYPPVQAPIAIQKFTVEGDFFGIPLVIGTVATEVADAWAAAYPDVGETSGPHTLLVTVNDYQTLMTALGFTSGDAHWKEIEAIFGQPSDSPVTKAVIARRVAAVAKVMRVTVVGFADGDYSIQVNADAPLVFAASGNTAVEIRDGLLALFVGNTTVSAVAQGVSAIDFTAINVGMDFDLTLASPGDTMTVSTITPNTGIGDDLTTARQENQSWFDIRETNKSFAAIAEAAKWAQAGANGGLNISHFWAETNDAAVQAGTAGNIALYLKALSYSETSIRFHHSGAEKMTAALCGRVLGFEVGEVQVSHRQLVGITGKNYAVLGVIGNFETANCGWYDKLRGGRVLYNRTCDGGFIELVRGKHIVRARIEGKILDLLSTNNITAYTDEEGVGAVKGEILAALRELGNTGGSGFIRMETIVVEITAIENMGTENNAKLKITGINWSAKVRIGTNEVEVKGYLSIT